MNRLIIKQIIGFLLVLAVSKTYGADLDAAKRDLWEARYNYRYSFVEPNGVNRYNYDVLRENWRKRGLDGELYDQRKVLLRAKDQFLAYMDQNDSQEARTGAAEAINEILSGQMNDGNEVLINALQERFPILSDPDTKDDPDRGKNDPWALKMNGSVDAEVADIDQALLAFGIGLKTGLSVFDRLDVVYDPITHTGILRAEDPNDTYQGFPYFMELKDGFHDPNDPSKILIPRSNAIQVELSLISRTAALYGQSAYEKAAKYFQMSGKKIGDDRNNFREKAKVALKAGHHTSYLTAAALGAVQNQTQYGENKGAKIATYAGQMKEFYKNLQNPNFNPQGNTDQFIPPTDKPISYYIEQARDAVNTAITDEKEYRSEKRDSNQRQSEIEAFTKEEQTYLSSLANLTGMSTQDITNKYNRLRTIDDQRNFKTDINNKVFDAVKAQYSPGKDYSSLGNLGDQLYRVLDAQYQIEQSLNTLKNIPERIKIEQERSGKNIQIIYDANTQSNAYEEALAWASSYSTSIGFSYSFGIGGGISFSTSFNPLSSIVANLRSTQNTIKSHEQATIEGANSEATVKNILLDMDNAVIAINRAKLCYDEEFTKLELLEHQVSQTIEDYAQSVQVRLDQQLLYLNNPEFRNWLTDSYKHMEASRAEAIKQLYTLGRALSFFWAEDYQNPILRGSGQPSVALTRYNSENFPDLDSVFSIGTANECGDFYLLLAEWDQKLRNYRSGSYQLVETKAYSLRDDILFKDLASNTNVSLNRRIRDFRDFLMANAFFDPADKDKSVPGFRITFPITLESLDFRQDWNQRIAYRPEATGVGGQVDPGIVVEFIAESGFQIPNRNSVQIDISQCGVVSLAGFFNNPTEGNTQIIKYDIAAPDSAFQQNRSEYSASKQALINGRTENGASYLINVFNGHPLAATEWQLTLNTNRSLNQDVDITKIQDIKIRIPRSTGKPVDPDTGKAYVFPAIQ